MPQATLQTGVQEHVVFFDALERALVFLNPKTVFLKTLGLALDFRKGCKHIFCPSHGANPCISKPMPGALKQPTQNHIFINPCI